MKLSFSQLEKQPRLSAVSVLESAKTESPLNDRDALLASRQFRDLRDKFRPGQWPGFFSEKPQVLMESGWVPAVDPSVRADLLKRPDVLEAAINFLVAKETELVDILQAEKKIGPEFGNSLVPKESQLCAIGATCVQLFPAQRNLPAFSHFTPERLDRQLKKPSKGLCDESVYLAYRLITLWPRDRQRIIQTLFPLASLEPEAVLQRFLTPSVIAIPSPGVGITRKRAPKALEMPFFLLLFPEYRPLLATQIENQKKQLHLAITAFSSTSTQVRGEFRWDKFLQLSKELVILGCEEAKLDAEGLLELPFKKPRLGEPRPMPVRSEL